MLSKLLTFREQLVILALAVSLSAGAVALYVTSERREMTSGETVTVYEIGSDAATDTVPIFMESEPIAAFVPAAPVTPDPSPISVAVRGAINRPGLYELEDGARVQDLIDAGGGITDNGVLDDINLAAPLIEGSTLTIPVGSERVMRDGVLVLRRAQRAAELNPARYTISGWREQAPAPVQQISGAPETAPSPTKSGKIDLNRASAAELETLPGIGPVLASEIIRYRSAQPFSTVEDLENVSGIGPKRLEQVQELVTVGGTE